MSEVIEIDPFWMKDEEALMRRLARMISSAGDRELFKKHGGYRWGLDGSNNYWADIEDGKLVIAYRYGDEDGRLQAWADFVRAFLGPRLRSPSSLRPQPEDLSLPE